MVDLHLITATEFKTNNLHFSNAEFFVLHDVLVYYRNHSLSVSLCVYLSVCLSLFTLFHLWPSKRGRRENTLQVHTSVVRVFFFSPEDGRGPLSHWNGMCLSRFSCLPCSQSARPTTRCLFFFCSCEKVGGQALGDIAKACQEAVTLLPHPLRSWDYRHVPPWSQIPLWRLFTSTALSSESQGTAGSDPLPGQLTALTQCLRGTVLAPETACQYPDLRNLTQRFVGEPD